MRVTVTEPRPQQKSRSDKWAAEGPVSAVKRAHEIWFREEYIT